MQGLSNAKWKQSHIIEFPLIQPPTWTQTHFRSLWGGVGVVQTPTTLTTEATAFPTEGPNSKVFTYTIISAKLKPKYQTSCTWRFLSPVSWTKLSQISLFLNISSSKLGLSHLRGCSKLRKLHQRMSKQSYRKKFLRHLEYFMNFKCFVRVFPRPSYRSYI